MHPQPGICHAPLAPCSVYSHSPQVWAWKCRFPVPVKCTDTRFRFLQDCLKDQTVSFHHLTFSLFIIDYKSVKVKRFFREGRPGMYRAVLRPPLFDGLQLRAVEVIKLHLRSSFLCFSCKRKKDVYSLRKCSK